MPPTLHSLCRQKGSASPFQLILPFFPFFCFRNRLTFFFTNVLTQKNVLPVNNVYAKSIFSTSQVTEPFVLSLLLRSGCGLPLGWRWPPVRNKTFPDRFFAPYHGPPLSSPFSDFIFFAYVKLLGLLGLAFWACGKFPHEVFPRSFVYTSPAMFKALKALSS